MPVAVSAPPALTPVPEFLQVIPSITEDVFNNGASKIVPEQIIDEAMVPLADIMLKELGITNPESIVFDPKKHIAFKDEDFEKTKRLTLSDLHITKPHQKPITDIGVTDPFPLFTDEAIAIMRWEMLCKETVQHGGRFADNANSDDDINIYLRGYCKSHTPFTYAAWTSPETVAVMSKMAGVELVNMMEFEIGHTNVTLKPQNIGKISAIAPTAETVSKKPVSDNVSNIEEMDPAAIKAAVTWHYDSPQLVCVLMMSDTTNMIGGETALQMGNGKVAKVAGPKRGYAAVLQGRILKHIATQPLGDFSERITSVGSYRPKNPMDENCFITTIRPTNVAGSRYNEFYRDFVDYKLEVLGQRIEVLRNQVRESVDNGDGFDQLKTIAFLQKDIIEYAEHIYQEFECVEDGIVPRPASFNQIKARWD